jgi:hypothetical protein
MEFQRSVFLPEPRIPNVKLPVFEEALNPAAHAAVEAARKHRAAAVAAWHALVDARPGGTVWVAARETDRRAALAGKPPAAVGKLLTGDPARYGAALALASTVADACEQARQQCIGAELADSAKEAEQVITDGLVKVVLAGLASGRAAGRVTSATMLAEEAAAEADPRLLALQNVRRWVDGAEPQDKPVYPTALYEAWLDLADFVAGREEGTWRQQRARAMAWQNAEAQLNGKRPVFTVGQIDEAAKVPDRSLVGSGVIGV